MGVRLFQYHLIPVIVVVVEALRLVSRMVLYSFFDADNLAV